MDLSHHNAHSLEGEIIGKYLLHKQIGRGGMASVFLAERISSSSAQPTWVAVKVMHPHLLNEKKAVDRFIEEIGMTALLKHPHICSVLDLGEYQGIPFLVMPLLKGRSLAELLDLKDGPPPEVIASIWIDLARGLSYAHNLKNHEGEPLAMIHRDISPHNAFVEYFGHAKLLDFGIAKLTPPGRREETSPLMGKIAYMSPEQLEEDAIDHRIDIWSLAVTFWELCAYQPLFDARQPMRLMYQVLSDEIKPPSTYRSLPSVFDQVSLTGLEREVEKRPQDVLLWVKPIEQWLRAQLNVNDESEDQTVVFDRARSSLVAEWMEKHFDLSQDILIAQLTPADRDERLKGLQDQVRPEHLKRPTPFSPLHGEPSPQGILSEDRNFTSQEFPTPLPSFSSPQSSSYSSTSLLSATPTTAQREVLSDLQHDPLPSSQYLSKVLLNKGILFTCFIAIALIGYYVLHSRIENHLSTTATKTLKLSFGKERKGGVMLDSTPCPSRVFLMPQHKLLGHTPLSQTFNVGVYRLRFEPTRQKKGCTIQERLIEIDEGKIQNFEVNIERDP